jgi:HAE1 family hydrophobic/amphiphilic exporter-1
VVLAVAAVSILASVVVLGRLGTAFFPDMDRGEFQVTYKLLPGTTLRESTNVGRQLAKLVDQHGAVAYTVVTVGSSTGVTPISEGSVYVKLKPRGERRQGDQALRKVLREELVRWPTVRTAIGEAEQVSRGAPIQVSVRGNNLDELNQLAAAMLRQARTVPGAADVDTTLEDLRPEVRVRLDRKAASDLGLDLGTVASLVRGLVAGEVVSQYQDADGDAYDVRLRLEEDQRRLREDLAEIYVPVLNAKGRGPASVPITQVASLEDSAAPSLIRHRTLMREVRLMASTQGRALGDVVGDIRARNSRLEIPPGIQIDYTGYVEEMEETFQYMYRALILAVIFIYAILASQFRSFFHPLAIMLSLPLALLGTALMLWAAGDTLNIMSMIGIIMLMGLVTKNAILLIDYTNRLRREGETRTRALIAAARVRLRPIVMTTTAMIFGMLPLAFEIGSGSEMRAPMARGVIGGLITSTLLTLIVVPVVYTYLDDWGTRLKEWWQVGTPATVEIPAEAQEEVRQ